MRIVSALLIFWGACIILYSIMDYYRDLVFIKNKTSAEKIFPNKMSLFTFLIMILFLAGYLTIDIIYLFREATDDSVLSSLILFFAAIFVLLMVTQERRKSVTIFDKTNETVRMLINLMEAKNPYMRGHSTFVYNIVYLFYNQLPKQVRSQINQAQLLDAALLHDIGKIGIDDRILNKNGPLTAEEWEVMRQYPAMGAAILTGTGYESIGEIIRLHHERMDGLGYYGVPGPSIPLESRMIMIADTFSALYSNRAYRGRQSFEDAMRIIRESAGRQLDADLVSVFLTLPQEALEAAAKAVPIAQQPQKAVPRPQAAPQAVPQQATQRQAIPPVAPQQVAQQQAAQQQAAQQQAAQQQAAQQQAAQQQAAQQQAAQQQAAQQQAAQQQAAQQQAAQQYAPQAAPLYTMPQQVVPPQAAPQQTAQQYASYTQQQIM